MLPDIVRRYGLAILSHLALILIWYLVVAYGHVPKIIVPSPFATAASLGGTNYHWIDSTLVTAAHRGDGRAGADGGQHPDRTAGAARPDVKTSEAFGEYSHQIYRLFGDGIGRRQRRVQPGERRSLASKREFPFAGTPGRIEI